MVLCLSVCFGMFTVGVRVYVYALSVACLPRAKVKIENGEDYAHVFLINDFFMGVKTREKCEHIFG